jgi:beta-catenin-like protein 1
MALSCTALHFAPLQVASSPELYPLLVELNPLPTLLACVMHENGDIAADTLELLRELTDAGARV